MSQLKLDFSKKKLPPWSESKEKERKETTKYKHEKCTLSGGKNYNERVCDRLCSHKACLNSLF